MVAYFFIIFSWPPGPTLVPGVLSKSSPDISPTLTFMQGGVSYVPGVPFSPLSFRPPEMGTDPVPMEPLPLLSCSLYLLSLLLGLGRGTCEGM